MSDTSASDHARDRHFLHYAAALAERGRGRTAPNPSVGVVVVQTKPEGGVIVGEAVTARGGRPHAEPIALAMAGAGAMGATLYTSLEPCSHHGKTPPCTDAIIGSGIKRVVCGLEDPDPRVAGQGIKSLGSAGIETAIHQPTDKLRLAAAGHLMRIRKARPYVQLKSAVSADGYIAPGDGTPRWVTSPTARARGHLLRACADAILIGHGTLKIDNPLLTCRLPGLADDSPIPVILDTHLISIADSRIAQRETGRRPIVFAATEKNIEGLDIERVATRPDSRLDPHAVLNRLAERGITYLLIEGGPTVAANFLEAGLVDEIQLFAGEHGLGGAGLKPFGEQGLEPILRSELWHQVAHRSLGGGTLRVFRRSDLMADLARISHSHASVTETK